ncbi:MAG: chemotaxis protein MotB [Verrucomicrobiaceae bacterium]|nr:chemotaxis protein MotB [Verrucomicrobiaceae bacterium]
MKNTMQPIIIKKKKAGGHAPHGGAWKVAFADFATAMMAFFMVMWLMAAASDPQKKAIAGYFNDAGGGLVGPGGANTGVIQFDHPQTSPEAMRPPPIMNSERGGENQQSAGEGVTHPSPVQLTDDQMREQFEKQETENLAKLKQELENELAKSTSALRELRDQIIIDYTGLGLRIQIVDKEQRPMFDIGSARMKNYSLDVLEALGPLLNSVENRISVTGHTDAVSYGSGASYSNWELSADRANAARRALVNGGYPEDKIVTVQGMGSAAPFKVEAPNDPINRRIAILVLKKSVEEALLGKQAVDSGKVIDSGGDLLHPELSPTDSMAPGEAPATTPASTSAPAPAAPAPTAPEAAPH